MSWLTVDDVQAANPSLTDAAVVLTLIPTAEAFTVRQLSAFLPRQVVTDLQHGHGHDELVLRKIPVCGIHSLKDSLSREWDTTDDIDPTSYAVGDPFAGIVTLDSGIGDAGWNSGADSCGRRVFQDGNRNVRAVYVAGYGERVDEPSMEAPVEDHEDFDEFPLPLDVVRFAACYIGFCINTSGSEGIESEAAGGYSYTSSAGSAGDFYEANPEMKAIRDAWQDGTAAR